jgi:hypothetical protein
MHSGGEPNSGLPAPVLADAGLERISVWVLRFIEDVILHNEPRGFWPSPRQELFPVFDVFAILKMPGRIHERTRCIPQVADLYPAYITPQF